MVHKQWRQHINLINWTLNQLVLFCLLCKKERLKRTTFLFFCFILFDTADLDLSHTHIHARTDAHTKSHVGKSKNLQSGAKRKGNAKKMYMATSRVYTVCICFVWIYYIATQKRRSARKTYNINHARKNFFLVFRLFSSALFYWTKSTYRATLYFAFFSYLLNLGIDLKLLPESARFSLRKIDLFVPPSLIAYAYKRFVYKPTMKNAR